MKKILFIASLDHSGSTLMELMLCSHPKVVGIGEANMLIDDDLRRQRHQELGRRICNCGEPLSKCSLWSKFLSGVENQKTKKFEEKYSSIIDLCSNEFRNAEIIVDSSKYIKPLNCIHELIQNNVLVECDIYVIHLIKDARSYLSSMKYRYRLNIFGIIAMLHKWFNYNNSIESYIIENKLGSIRIGYEELCFNSKLILTEVCKKVNISFNDSMLDISNTKGHIGVGNPMRNHPTKSKNIIYDSRWFFETQIQIIYHCFPKIKKYNERVVYSNIFKNRSERLFNPA